MEAPPAAPTPHSAREPRAREAPKAPAEAYKVRRGDSLWPIAKKQLGPNSSQAQVARRVERLGTLNLRDRIASGDPDLIVAGERLRLR
jgi:Tfp pilus assembly protein FimV